MRRDRDRIRHRQAAPAPAATTSSRWPASVLVLIVLVGGALRLADLRESPPGLNQDEASNAWNAYCLLKTGMDQTGVRWPVFSTRCFGENRSTLYLYWVIPFEAIGGLNVWTTRLPSAVGGVITLLLVYYIGGRMFGRTTGLVAAGLLALNPWHIQQSRWGHEAALCPLLVAATVAAILWANLPFDDADRRPRPLRAILAGVLAGISCYGYPAMRAFLPVFVVAAVLVTWPAWWGMLKTRRGGLAIAAIVASGAVTFGPLAWKHVTESSEMGKRLQTTRVWNSGDPLVKKVLAVLSRYPGHFGPDFLFVRGDQFEIQAPPGCGQFHWYMMPLMLAGLAVTVRRFRASRAARVLLVGVITYPAGDCLSAHLNNSMHALRSLPGLVGLILLGAVGAVWIGSWLYQRHRPAMWATISVFAMVVVALNVRFLNQFFVEFNRRPFIYHMYHTDLMEACEWLKPKLDSVDAVFCTTQGTNMPYAITLVGLSYDPRQWLQDQRAMGTSGPWEVYVWYGKMHFLYGDLSKDAINQLKNNGRPDRVVFIVRPGEVKGLDQPSHVINRPDGQAVLLIYEQTL